MRPNLLNKIRGILLLKNPLNGRKSGSIQEVLELRGIKTRTGFLNARQIAMPQDGTDARKSLPGIVAAHGAADPLFAAAWQKREKRREKQLEFR